MQPGLALCHRSLPAWLLLSALPALSACQDGSMGRPADRDDMPLPTSAYWTVADEPFLSIGREDDPNYQFTEILSAGRLSGGGWFALDTRSNRVRIYDVAGVLVRDLGRGGEGPGEFLRAAWAAEASPGRLVVLDNSLRRLSLFQSTGTLERVISLPLPPEVPGTVPSPVGLVGNEFIWSAFNFSDLSACQVGALIPDTLVWLATHLPVGGDVAEPRNPTRVLTRVVSHRYWGSDLNLMGRCGPTVRTFAPRVRGRLHPPRLVIRGAREGALVLLDLDSDASDTVALPLPRAPLTAAAARAHTDSVAGAPLYDERGIPLTDPRGQNLYRQRLAAEPLPDSLPQLSELLMDPMGLFWARGFQLDARPASQWWVLSPTGELLATVSLPPGFRLLEVGADYVLGVQVDPLGVQRLEAFQLFRPAEPR